MGGPVTGIVWLVGAGPGDPLLLTLKGREILDGADTVVHDRLVSGEILATIPGGTKLVNAGGVLKPKGQEEINRILIDEARQGRKVVRLKGGDPFLFGRGGEELLALVEAGIPFGVVPGVSAALAVPACAGIPLTHRGISSALHVITWRCKDGVFPGESLKVLAAAGGTLVILMGGGDIAEMGEKLLAAGFPPETQGALIESGSTPRQRVEIIPLARFAERKARIISGDPPPVLVVIGKVCSLAEGLLRGTTKGSHCEAPLKNLRLVVTLPEPRNKEACGEIRALGGTAIPFPCIKIVPKKIEPSSFLPTPGFPWLVFTSAAGVECFFNGFIQTGGDLRVFAQSRFAVVGPATARALRERGFVPDCMPPLSGGRALGEALAARMTSGEGAILAGAAKKHPALGAVLEERNIPFRNLAVYDTVPVSGDCSARRVIEAGAFDGVFFSSPSAAESFAASLDMEDLSPIRAFCTGRTTAAAAEKAGMTVYTAADPSLRSLVDLAASISSLSIKGL
jgi:uroporphyrinogen III methyltransferase/synthase